MTLPRRHIQIEPMTMTRAEVAECVFRRSVGWLDAHLADYPDFPRPSDRTGLFHFRAVRDWVDRQHGMTDAASPDLESMIEKAVKHGAEARAVSGR